MLPPSAPIRKDLPYVLIPKLVSGATTFLISVGSMRFFDPAAYGVLSFGISCLVLFEALANSALDLGTMGLVTGRQPCEGPQIQPAEKAAVRMKLALGAALLAVSALSGEWLGFRFFHAAGGRRLFLVLSLAGTGILMLRSAQLYFQARLRFRHYGAIDLANAALRLILTGVVLFRGSASALSVLACFAAVPMAIVTVVFWRGRAAAGWSSVHAHWRDARDLLRLSTPVLATFSASAIVSRLDIFFVALRSNTAQLGLYGGALTIATVPEVLGTYLAPVFLPRILPACQDGSFPRLYRRLQTRIYLVCGALLATGLIAGKPLLSLALPVKYSLSADLVLILIPGTLAAASFFPLTLNFLMLKSSKVFLITDSLAAPVLAAAYYLLTPIHGAVAAAWITCIYRLVRTAAVQTAGARYNFGRPHGEESR